MGDSRSAQLQHNIREFIMNLATATEEAKSSAPLLEYLRVAAMFRNYSFANCCLIAMQCPTATRVAGFRTWQRLGRQVRRGAKSIRILAPVTYRRRNENDERTDEVAVTFRSVGVFDIKDTSGPPLPEAPVLTGAGCSDDLALALTLFADDRGIIIKSEKLSGTAMGLSKGGTIILDDTLDGADRFSVLVHEVGHEVLRHKDRRAEVNKKEREIEAESVAFTVCQHFNVPCTAPAYLALHGADAKDITARLESMVGVIQSIITGIETNLTVINITVANN